MTSLTSNPENANQGGHPKKFVPNPNSRCFVPKARQNSYTPSQTSQASPTSTPVPNVSPVINFAFEIDGKIRRFCVVFGKEDVYVDLYSFKLAIGSTFNENVGWFKEPPYISFCKIQDNIEDYFIVNGDMILEYKAHNEIDDSTYVYKSLMFVKFRKIYKYTNSAILKQQLKIMGYCCKSLQKLIAEHMEKEMHAKLTEFASIPRPAKHRNKKDTEMYLYRKYLLNRPFGKNNNATVIELIKSYTTMEVNKIRLEHLSVLIADPEISDEATAKYQEQFNTHQSRLETMTRRYDIYLRYLQSGKMKLLQTPPTSSLIGSPMHLRSSSQNSSVNSTPESLNGSQGIAPLSPMYYTQGNLDLSKLSMRGQSPASSTATPSPIATPDIMLNPSAISSLHPLLPPSIMQLNGMSIGPINELPASRSVFKA